MPRTIPPWKSGVHRNASIALFRALLSQSRTSGLDEQISATFRDVVRNRFKRVSRVQSIHRLADEFGDGYEAVNLLIESANGDTIATTRLTHLISEASPSLKTPPPPSPLLKPPQLLSTPRPAHDAADSILARPRHTVSGIRRVPKLVWASGYPMLRTKKPQPASLSGYLRQRITATLRWHDKLAEILDWHIPIAEYEDQWDDILLQDHGVRKEEDVSARYSLNMYWRFDIFTSRVWLEGKLRAETTKKAERAKEYQRIIEEEMRLATQERHVRRDKRREVRKIAAAQEAKEAKKVRKPRKTKVPTEGAATGVGLKQIDANSVAKRKPGRPRKVQGSFGLG